MIITVDNKHRKKITVIRLLFPWHYISHLPQDRMGSAHYETVFFYPLMLSHVLIIVSEVSPILCHHHQLISITENTLKHFET
jgi:hypothetical protein